MVDGFAVGAGVGKVDVGGSGEFARGAFDSAGDVAGVLAGACGGGVFEWVGGAE